MAACNFYKNMSDGGFKFIEINGEDSIDAIKEFLMSQLA